jgi:hypothetical protein
MSLFSLISQTPVEQNFPYWVPFRNDEGKYSARDEYLNFIKRARSEVKIVCGECDPEFYDSQEFINVLNTHLENGVKFYLAFHKGENPKEAGRIFKERNPKFMAKINSLPSDKRAMVKLYRLPRRPEQHYLVIDARHLVLEQKHKNGEARSTLCVPDRPNEAKGWSELFESLINKKGKIIDD